MNSETETAISESSIAQEYLDSTNKNLKNKIIGTSYSLATTGIIAVVALTPLEESTPIVGDYLRFSFDFYNKLGINFTMEGFKDAAKTVLPIKAALHLPQFVGVYRAVLNRDRVERSVNVLKGENQ